MLCNRKTALVLSVLILCLAGLPLFAQTVTGTLSGRVVDSTGAVIPGAKLQIKGEQTGLVRDTVSNDEGYYTFTFVPLGAYQVTASSPGFKTVLKKGVEVTLDNTTNSDFKLEPATTTEVVTVTGEAPLIDTTAGDVKGALDSRAVENFLLPTRNFVTLAEVVPGFQTNAVSGQNNPTLSSGSSVQFNGTGTRGASFQVNGVNNDDSSENQNRQGVNPSTIQEVKVLTNSFSSEFGRSYGAVVLVQTKQGTNQYHGDAYWVHQNSEFTARDWFTREGTPIPVQRRHQFGGTIGGPIKTDKLFFYGSVDQVKSGGFRSYSRDIFTPAEQAAGPDPTLPAADRAWLQGILDRFPKVAPNDPARSARAYTTTVKYHYPDQDYSGRLDWNISSSNYLTGRYQLSQQERRPEDVIIGENALQQNRQQNVGVTLTHTYSPVMTGEFRFGIGRRRTRVDIMAGNDTPIVRWSYSPYSSSIMGNAGGFPIHRFQTDYQYVYNHVWSATPKLTVKAGTDVRMQQLNDLADNNSRGLYYFGTVNDAIGANGIATAGPYYDFLHGRAASYSTAFGNFKLGNRNKEANLYQQLDYKATPNLTLNFGAREEYVRSPREVRHLVDYGYGSEIAVEPRFGFAYSPDITNPWVSKITGGPGKFVVRGGFGMFHGRLFQTLFSQSGASIRMNPPSAATTTVNNPTSVSNPLGPGFTYTPGWPTFRIGFTQVDPDFHLPYTEQWNLTIERMLPAQMGLSMSYVGNRGVGLPFFDITNRAEFPIVAPNSPNVTAMNRGVLMNCVLWTDQYNNAPPAGCITTRQQRTNDRRPNPQFSGIYVIDNGSWSYYNALQIQLNKRVTHGLSFQAAYTFSKAIDTGSEPTYTGIDVGQPVTKDGGPASMRALSLFDTPHRFTINYVYEFPFFKNQRVGLLGDGILSSAVGKVLGGWQLSGTTIYSTGNPFTVFAGYDRNADGVGGDRPDLLDRSVLGRTINNPRIDPATGRQYGQGLLPTSAFLPPGVIYYGTDTAGIAAAYSLRPFNPNSNFVGTLGRNTFRSDAQFNFDAALGKNFRISERTRLMARWEVYNLMNHPQFMPPNQTATSVQTATATRPGDSLLGKITSQRNNRVDTGTGSRYMQFAFRFVF